LEAFTSYGGDGVSVRGPHELRGFGDGFAIILLPVYLSALGYGPVEVGIVATAALLGSAPATATAISALAIVERQAPTVGGRFADEAREGRLSELIMASVHWLADRQNADGGWGDTDKCPSNLATTMLVRSAFALTAFDDEPSGEADESRPGYDIIVQALSGLMSVTGEPGGEPVKVGVAMLDVVTGLVQPSSGVLRLDGSKLTDLWTSDEVLSNHYASSVALDDHLYGFHGRQEQGPSLRCVRASTKSWRSRPRPARRRSTAASSSTSGTPPDFRPT
jgi:hypothetical protein